MRVLIVACPHGGTAPCWDALVASELARRGHEVVVAAEGTDVQHTAPNVQALMLAPGMLSRHWWPTRLHPLSSVIKEVRPDVALAGSLGTVLAARMIAPATPVVWVADGAWPRWKTPALARLASLFASAVAARTSEIAGALIQAGVPEARVACVSPVCAGSPVSRRRAPNTLNVLASDSASLALLQAAVARVRTLGVQTTLLKVPVWSRSGTKCLDHATFGQADVFCVLDERLDGPLRAAEAMAHGVPVLAVRTPGMAAWIEPGRTGWLLPPQEPLTWAAHLSALVLRPELLQAMGHAARDLTNQWTAARSADTIEALLAGSLSVPSGAGTGVTI